MDMMSLSTNKIQAWVEVEHVVSHHLLKNYSPFSFVGNLQPTNVTIFG